MPPPLPASPRAFAVATAALLLLATASSARAQKAPDPASFLPESFRVYVEGRNVEATLDAALSLGSDQDVPPEAKALFEALRIVRDARGRRFAFGAELGSQAWALFVEAADADAAVALARTLKKATGGGTIPLAIGAFGGVAANDEVAENVVAAAKGEAPSMAKRKSLASAGRAKDDDAVFVHVDLSGTRLLRLGVARPRDYLQALFTSHVLLAAATAESVVARATFDADGAVLKAVAPMKPLGPDRAYAAPESRPGERVLRSPEGVVARLSLRRDVAAFWDGRATIAPESARAGIAEFRNNLTVLLGGTAPEDVFSGLGTQFDLFVGAPPKQDPAPRHPFPTLALVAEVKDAALRAEWLLGFQTTIGVVNAQAAQERAPRFLLETVEGSGVPVASARYLAELLPEGDDDRLQLRPSLAFAEGRMILGTHPDIVGALAAGAVAGRFEPRPRGDALLLDGEAAAAALSAAIPFLAPREALKSGDSEAEVARRLRFAERLLRRAGHVRAAFCVDGAEATFSLGLGAKGRDA